MSIALKDAVKTVTDAVDVISMRFPINWEDITNKPITASGSGSGSLSGVTMDAILTVVQQHLSVALDVKTGHLQLYATDVTEQDIVSQIAAKVIASINLSVINGDLTIEGSD